MTGFVKTFYFILSVSVTALAVSLVPQVSRAQGVDAEKTLDKMFEGSVRVEKEESSEEIEQALIASAESAGQTASEIRKLFEIDRVTLVEVPQEIATSDPVAEAMANNEEEVALMREAVEGSALLYNMLESRALLIGDLLGAEFTGENTIRLYVAGDPAK